MGSETYSAISENQELLEKRCRFFPDEDMTIRLCRVDSVDMSPDPPLRTLTVVCFVCLFSVWCVLQLFCSFSHSELFSASPCSNAAHICRLQLQITRAGFCVPTRMGLARAAVTPLLLHSSIMCV